MWFDELIGFFSPEVAHQRLLHRQAIKVKQRKYEGASKGRRTKYWCPSFGNANADSSGALTVLRGRARDLVKNDPYAAKAVEVVSNNLVGKGIMPQLPEGDIANAWKRWTASTACDFNGLMNFPAMQRLAAASTFVSGEVIARRRIVTGEDFPLKIQMLESDHFINEETNLNTATGNRIVQGVEVDGDDRPVAYHMYKTHPGASGAEFQTGSLDIVRVKKDDIAHVYKVTRPGQLRGITWFAPVIILLRELGEYSDAQLLKQKVSSLYAGFIKSLDDDGFESADDDEADEITLEPGSMAKLPSGTDITFSQPPSTEGYPEYMKIHLHAVAAGLGITYEALTGDLSQVNFSSARLGWLEMGRNLDAWRASILNTQFNAKVFDWFLDAARLTGLNVPRDGQVPSWTSPKREMVDPTKEVPAKIKAIRGGLTTLSEAIRESGIHPDEHLAEYKKDIDKLAELGITLDSDASKKRQDGDNVTEQEVTNDNET